MVAVTGSIWWALFIMGFSSRALGETYIEERYTDYLPGSYNALYPPTVRNRYGAGPVHVGVSVYIIGLHDFDPYTMQMTADFYLRLGWMDDRLHTDRTNARGMINLRGGEDYIWVPDVYIPDAYKVTKPEGSSTFCRIDSDGSILFSQKLQAIIPCSSHLEYFPFDHVICNMEFESYSMNSSSISMTWQKPTGYAADVQNSTLELSLYEIHESSRYVHLSTGEYTRLRVEAEFMRRPGYYLKIAILPAFCIVIFAYLTFFMDPKIPLPRLLMALVMFMSIVYVAEESKTTQPHYATWTALDVWVMVCFIFVGVALLQTILVITFNLKVVIEKVVDTEEKVSESKCHSCLRKCADAGDKLLWIVYPGVFTAFTICYLGGYLSYETGYH